VTDCRQWISYADDLNCTLIAVDKHGKMTLREVSERLGVSFVRIKQIQDKALLKASKNKDIASFFES
jgi:DNA-directed RNA polymerase sigma subunit (sigma70/sigma32)